MSPGQNYGGDLGAVSETKLAEQTPLYMREVSMNWFHRIGPNILFILTTIKDVLRAMIQVSLGQGYLLTLVPKTNAPQSLFHLMKAK
jgi:hypothetical protein